MRVLAIDPGFDRMGVAVLEKKGGKENLLYSSCIITNRKLAAAERLDEIRQALVKTIAEHSPNSLAIESLFFTKNRKTGLAVAEARGVALSCAAEAGLEVFEYKPVEVKMAVTGFGGSDKKQVTYMVKRLIETGSGKKLDDEYDAIAVGLTHFAVHKNLSGNFDS